MNKKIVLLLPLLVLGGALASCGTPAPSSEQPSVPSSSEEPSVPSSSEEPSSEITPVMMDVYFDAPESWGDNINIYYWNDLGNNAAWPGEAMEEVAEDLYKFNYDIANYPNVIFNDGANQTADLLSPTDPTLARYVDGEGWVSTERPATYDNYFQIDKSLYTTTYNELRVKRGYNSEANQSGDVKVLVVPVDFIGYEASKMPLGEQGTLDALNIAFFGDPTNEEHAKNLYHHSLASYYKMSSYGKCNITGTVLPWWHTELTPANFVRRGGPANLLISQVQEYYENGEGSELIDLDDYDANNDGYVDLVHFVYTCPTGVVPESIDTTNTFWAYCTEASTHNEDLDRAVISRYIFASYEFLYEGGNVALDGTRSAWTTYQKTNNLVKFSTHTFIHESGHGLGLPDYYSYDYNGDNPLGGLDMMDHNIGDHNALSKAWYGWVNPYVVTGDADITLGAYETTGDCILVPIRGGDNFNGEHYTLLDEYILIQFDTGKGVAEHDATYGYSSMGKYYSEPGVRVLHADARIGLFGSDGTFLGYNRSYNVRDGYFADLAHDNTQTRTQNGNDLLELILPDGSRNNKAANNASLFQAGDELINFEMNTVLPTSSFNEKYNLGYNIYVEAVEGNEYAKIQIRVAE